MHSTVHILQNHFQGIYNEPCHSGTKDICSLLEGPDIPGLSPEHLSILERAFSKDKIKDDVFSISPLKAPGIDGKHALFFQKLWHVVGYTTMKTSLAFLNSRFLFK